LRPLTESELMGGQSKNPTESVRSCGDARKVFCWNIEIGTQDQSGNLARKDNPINRLIVENAQYDGSENSTGSRLPCRH
jgi:hypothetical protein